MRALLNLFRVFEAGAFIAKRSNPIRRHIMFKVFKNSLIMFLIGKNVGI